MTFRGWPVEAIEFYEGLVADNSKAYWTANKQTYDEAVHGPTAALLEQVAPEFGAGKIFRPYRDVRFSADKTPYKTGIGAVASKDPGTVHYVQISADGLFVGTGYYHMAKDQLERYRRAVDDDKAGAKLETLVADMSKGGYDVHGSDALKTAPRGYPADHPRIELLRYKGITVSKGWPPAAWLGTARAADRVVKVWRDAKPFNEWLKKHVGPSTEPPTERGR
jgi:uncharacterized protein (TIGR02453 family)